MQVFNRGGFSSGHLQTQPNTNLVYKYKSNNMGIYLGKISNFNSSKGHISFTTASTLSVGDKIGIENKNNDTSLYTISELMVNNKNLPTVPAGTKVKIGRMKGDIFVGNKIFKLADKQLTNNALATINKEQRKRNISCKLSVRANAPIKLNIFDDYGFCVEELSDVIPQVAVNSPITSDRLISQLQKTHDTPFNFKNIEIDLDNNLFIPGISCINKLRRDALCTYEQVLVNSFKRNLELDTNSNLSKTFENIEFSSNTKKISVLLNILNTDFDYSNLKNIDNIYIPFKYFVFKEFAQIIEILTNKFNVFIYMPTIIRKNYNKLITQKLKSILELYNIKGFVVSNIGNFELLKNYQNSYQIIGNYTLNVFNNLTIQELPCDIITLSPELKESDLLDICNTNASNHLELIVHSKIPLMNSNYCLLGKSNKCYSSCKHLCNTSEKFYIKDRFGFLFRVIPDNIDTVTTIYNNRTTIIDYKNFNIDSIRIDVLDESIQQINSIIDKVRHI